MSIRVEMMLKKVQVLGPRKERSNSSQGKADGGDHRQDGGEEFSKLLAPRKKNF